MYRIPVDYSGAGKPKPLTRMTTPRVVVTFSGVPALPTSEHGRYLIATREGRHPTRAPARRKTAWWARRVTGWSTTDAAGRTGYAITVELVHASHTGDLRPSTMR